MVVEIRLVPIGLVRVNLSDDEVRREHRGVPGVIEVFDEFAEGLRGIDGFTHIIVVTYLHKVTDEQRRTLVVKPRRLLRLGLRLEELPQVGVFATDSPHRPNPIAITIARLVKREGRLLYVEGLDLFDGTPVLDVKPYTPDRVVADARAPPWYVELMRRAKELAGEGLGPANPV